MPTLLQLAIVVGGARAMDNGLARTPPMGWSSWNAYGGHQTDAHKFKMIRLNE